MLATEVSLLSGCLNGSVQQFLQPRWKLLIDFTLDQWPGFSRSVDKSGDVEDIGCHAMPVMSCVRSASMPEPVVENEHRPLFPNDGNLLWITSVRCWRTMGVVAKRHNDGSAVFSREACEIQKT